MQSGLREGCQFYFAAPGTCPMYNRCGVCRTGSYSEDIIINPAVVDFYRSIEEPRQKTEVVKMDIPAEYQDAVLELLLKLRGETAVQMHPTNNKVIKHPDLDHLVIVYKNQTGNEKCKEQRTSEMV